MYKRFVQIFTSHYKVGICLGHALQNPPQGVMVIWRVLSGTEILEFAKNLWDPNVFLHLNRDCSSCRLPGSACNQFVLSDTGVVREPVELDIETMQ